MIYQEDTAHRRITEDEISLVDLFLIIWKRKVMIVVLTLMVTVAAAGISYVLPEVYKTYAIFEPAKDSNGKPVVDPQNLRETINAGVYQATIAQQLNLPAGSIPDINAAVPKNTSLVKITVESSDAVRAVAIVEEALQIITADLQESSALLTTINQEKVATLQLEKERLLQQIELTTKQLEKVENTISTLETVRKDNLSTSADYTITVLLYANELHNQRNYAYELRDKLAMLSERKEEVNLAEKNIRLELERAEKTTIHAQPFVPAQPIKPNKPLMIALACFLGFFGSIVIVFIAEFIKNVRQQQLKP